MLTRWMSSAFLVALMISSSAFAAKKVVIEQPVYRRDARGHQERGILIVRAEPYSKQWVKYDTAYAICASLEGNYRLPYADEIRQAIVRGLDFASETKLWAIDHNEFWTYYQHVEGGSGVWHPATTWFIFQDEASAVCVEESWERY